MNILLGQSDNESGPVISAAFEEHRVKTSGLLCNITLCLIAWLNQPQVKYKSLFRARGP